MTVSSLQIMVSPEIGSAGIDELESVFADKFNLHQSQSLDFSPDWVTFVAIVKDIGVAAGTATALAKLGTELGKWRRKFRKESQSVKVIVIATDGDRLDLRTATDDEIEAWFRKRGEEFSSGE